MERASEMQTEAPVGIPPKLKPAVWGETDTHYVADPGDVQLTALPMGVVAEQGMLMFPKDRFASVEDARTSLGRVYPSLAHNAANPDGTFNMYGVELFSSGTWNGDRYTDQDLDEMVRAHSAIGQDFKPWVKLGHDEQQQYAAKSNGLPSVGWIGNLRRIGSKLYGDLMRVPAVVYSALESKGYRTRSPEIFWDLKWHDGKVYNRVLRAVALLGAELPANPMLGDVFHAYAGKLDGDLRSYDMDLPQNDRAPGEPVQIGHAMTPVVPGELPRNSRPPADVLPVSGDRTPLSGKIPSASDFNTLLKARLGQLVPGIPVHIENLAGSVRSGTSADGTTWSNALPFHYGEIPGTVGMDGDPVDVFIGPDPQGAPMAYIVNTLDPTSGTMEPDEQKVMLGFASLEHARQAFLSSYDSPDFLGSITEMPLTLLGQRLLDSGGAGGALYTFQDLTRVGRDVIAEAREMALKGYYDPSQPRDGNGRWTHLSGAEHMDRAATTGEGKYEAHIDLARAAGGDAVQRNRHLATAMAGKIQEGLNKRAAGAPDAPDDEELQGHLTELKRLTTTLRIQVHHAKLAGKTDEAAEREAAFRHYQGIQASLKAALKKGTGTHVVHHFGEALDGTAGLDKPAPAPTPTPAPAPAPAPAPEPAPEPFTSDAASHLRMAKDTREASRAAPEGSVQRSSLKRLGDAHADVAAAHKALDAGDLDTARDRLDAADVHTTHDAGGAQAALTAGLNAVRDRLDAAAPFTPTSSGHMAEHHRIGLSGIDRHAMKQLAEAHYKLGIAHRAKEDGRLKDADVAAAHAAHLERKLTADGDTGREGRSLDRLREGLKVLGGMGVGPVDVKDPTAEAHAGAADLIRRAGMDDHAGGHGGVSPGEYEGFGAARAAHTSLERAHKALKHGELLNAELHLKDAHAAMNRLHPNVLSQIRDHPVAAMPLMSRGMINVRDGIDKAAAERRGKPFVSTEDAHDQQAGDLSALAHRATDTDRRASLTAAVNAHNLLAEAHRALAEKNPTRAEECLEKAKAAAVKVDSAHVDMEHVHLLAGMNNGIKQVGALVDATKSVTSPEHDKWLGGKLAVARHHVQEIAAGSEHAAAHLTALRALGHTLAAKSKTLRGKSLGPDADKHGDASRDVLNLADHLEAEGKGHDAALVASFLKGGPIKAPSKPVKTAAVDPVSVDDGHTMHDMPTIRHVAMGLPGGKGRGSNPGQVYMSRDGTERYIKDYSDPTQAMGEHVANRLYAALGVPVAKTGLAVRADGGLSHVSQIVKGLESPKLSAVEAQKLAQGLFADAALGNWDVVGSGGNNLIRGKDGQIYRIDSGGSLLHRAKNGRKDDDHLDALTEPSEFFNPSRNPAYADLLGKAGYSSWSDIPGAEQHIDRVVSALSDENLDKLLKPVPGVPAHDVARMRQMLVARRTAMGKMKVELAKANVEKAKRRIADEKAAKVARKAMAGGKLPPATVESHEKRLKFAKTQDGFQKITARGMSPITSQGLYVAKLADLEAREGRGGHGIGGTRGAAGTYKTYQAIHEATTLVIRTPDKGPDRGIRGILKAGRFKSQQELPVGTTEGAYTPEGRKRREGLMGIWDGKDNSQSPIYGAMHLSADHVPPPPFHHAAKHYGEYMFEVHPHVMDRSSFSGHDSLGYSTKENILNKDEAKVAYAHSCYPDASGPARTRSSYTEGQVLGGVTMHDIRLLQVPSHAHADKARKYLDDAGFGHLPVYVVAPGQATPAIHHSGPDVVKVARDLKSGA